MYNILPTYFETQIWLLFWEGFDFKVHYEDVKQKTQIVFKDLAVKATFYW